MDKIIYDQIGIIRSPFNTNVNMPVQPAAGKGIKGSVELDPEYLPGLKDIEGFSHIILIYHLHLSKGFNLVVRPFFDTEMRGVFATRAPRRPNQIGLSVVKLIKAEGNILYIENVDIVDGTPLLDIKPYVQEFDAAENIRTGWFNKHGSALSDKRSDKRFINL